MKRQKLYLTVTVIALTMVFTDCEKNNIGINIDDYSDNSDNVTPHVINATDNQCDRCGKWY